MPCIFLQFGAVENGIAATKLMQIFTRQAAMVDALITHFIEQAKRRKESGGVAGGAAGEVPEVPIVGVVGVGGGENPYEGGFLAIVGVFFRFETFFFALQQNRTQSRTTASEC